MAGKINKIKEEIVVNMWDYLNTFVNRNYRLHETWGKRSELADFYCKGKGIEVGASAYPVKICSKESKVLYVDCIDRNKTSDYKTKKGLPYVHIDILDEMEELSHIKNNSLDFIIHCHVLEHCKNPIGVIKTHLTKVKRNGVLFIAIPNKSYIFDKNRPLTKWDHFVTDDKRVQGGYSDADMEHFREYLCVSTNYKGDLEKEIERLLKDDYRPHFHVWDFDSFYDFLLRTNERLNNAFVIEHYSENRQHRKTPRETREIITVLRKR